MISEIPFLPERTIRPRETGLTMVMDKGISLRKAEDFLEVGAADTDIVKLGFGTSLITPNSKEKIKLYQEAGMKVYPGGTLFEAFIARNAFDDYRRFLDKMGFDAAEVSDGSVIMTEEDKCQYIKTLSGDRVVLSEVGSKEEGILISPGKWVKMMRSELDAGAWKVIAEARESGTVGIYRPSGNAHTTLVNKILQKIALDDILWEAPKKQQQVWFIKQHGYNVNLGNIAPDDLIPLEALRLGLRGDTFFEFLPEETTEALKQKA